MRIPLKKPNSFIFNGYFYKDVDLVQIALIEAIDKKKRNDLALLMIPASNTPNIFGQKCPKVFMTGEIQTSTSNLSYVIINTISDELRLPEKFLNDHNFPLYEIPEELILEMLDMSKVAHKQD